MKNKQPHCVKSDHVKDIIDVLLYNSFVELPGTNLQNLGKSKDSFISSGQAR